jgi:AraC-type DNA-binding domain-containing proteins
MIIASKSVGKIMNDIFNPQLTFRVQMIDIRNKTSGMADIMKNPFKNQFLSEKTFRKWFITSFLIILTFIVSGILLYLGALAVTKHAVLISQEQSAEHIKELIDIELQNLKKDISVLSLNDRIISAAYIGRPSTGNDYYNYHKAGKELMGIYFYKNVQDIYVYYRDGDCFVGCYNLIGFDNKAFTQKHFGMSRKEWKSFAASRLTSSFLKLKNDIYFLCPLKKDNSGAVTSLAIAELDEKKLKQILPAGNKTGKDESYSYIISSDGSMIISTGQSSEIKYGYGTLKQGENYIDDTVVTCKKIENTDWEYIGIVLLQEPELSLAQIAERVGYGNVQTMLRVFKKSEELTPGQYRAENGEAI